ncbi:hypothetical protein SAY87_011085 [Trapa incisa]|uniref:Uncharacterized protein n=1 Tax=Trapa incisa TaxID=236973 RepID=A0AAN7JIW9_9MYRT|nr:hypothetical protein SAY87_011085 [Trapa incisa]
MGLLFPQILHIVKLEKMDTKKTAKQVHYANLENALRSIRSRERNGIILALQVQKQGKYLQKIMEEEQKLEGALET